MFLPGENFFRAAIETDPALFDDALRQRVVLASPLSLISLLWGAAQAWKEQRMTETAAEVCVGGPGALQARRHSSRSTSPAWATRCEKSVEAYNKAIGSLDRRVLPAARRMKELGAVTGEDLDVRDPIDVRAAGAACAGAAAGSRAERGGRHERYTTTASRGRLKRIGTSEAVSREG